MAMSGVTGWPKADCPGGFRGIGIDFIEKLTPIQILGLIYDRIPEIKNGKYGDPVKICLNIILYTVRKELRGFCNS